MTEKRYSAGMVNHSFWFTEFKLFIDLLNEGKTTDDIRELNDNENIFAASTPDRGTHIFRNLLRRIKHLNDDLLQLFGNLDISNQKILNLVTIMVSSDLFFDFMHEVFRDKMIMGSYEITDSDYRIFFKTKQEQHAQVAKWTDMTIKRLSGTYKQLLHESGLTDNNTGTRKILLPVIDPELEDALKRNNMTIYLQAITGVVS